MSSLLRRVLRRSNSRGKRLVGRPRNKMRRRKRVLDEEKIRNFEKWCREAGIALHPQLYIGYRGSCADIGVVARDYISKGTKLAIIPHRALLTATNSHIRSALLQDKIFHRQMKTMNSWVPLLLALLAEYDRKSSSYWGPYLSLVPSKNAPGPLLQWSHKERGRLLRGTGVEQRVLRDKENIARDYSDIVLPFMRRNPELFRKTCHSRQLYEQLVWFVMGYSFSDDEERDVCRRTMMVPFVDLLNHHSHHHAELSFYPDRLELVAIRNIDKGSEVMNTYGPLPNASLLHLYGFSEVGNPHDVALLQSSTLREVYKRSCLERSHDMSRAQRWERLNREDLMEDEYEVNSSGQPELSLLAVVKLLLVDKDKYSRMKEKVMTASEEELTLEGLSSQEKDLVHQLCVESLAKFPEPLDNLQTKAETCRGLMTDKEYYSLLLASGQLQCLQKLEKQFIQNS